MISYLVIYKVLHSLFYYVQSLKLPMGLRDKGERQGSTISSSPQVRGQLRTAQRIKNQMHLERALYS